MDNIKWIFALYSLGAILSMALIGIAVALRNIPLIFIFLILLFVIMGFGFKTKKKMRDAGML
ncbi:YlaF family protein [Psychrobacillus antarcticus]|uniref:YlaF family protein n=1 Tax=Psychrobacillus antarcticus TaxID=2879115 RepID=UPI0024083772|nr:YlaF family protein [Psychrobacillus antarcticus]